MARVDYDLLHYVALKACDVVSPSAAGEEFEMDLPYERSTTAREIALVELEDWLTRNRVTEWVKLPRIDTVSTRGVRTWKMTFTCKSEPIG